MLVGLIDLLFGKRAVCSAEPFCNTRYTRGRWQINGGRNGFKSTVENLPFNCCMSALLYEAALVSLRRPLLVSLGSAA